MSKIKKKGLESDLQSLEVFSCPKLSLEQYHTPPSIAAEVLHAIDLDVGLSDKTVLDLGCGCGILGLGCVRCGSAKVLGIDVDEAALKIARENRDDVGLTSEHMRFLQYDVLDLKKENLPTDFQQVDVCVTNPPFGTRTKCIDFWFVKKGLEFSDVIYSIHKSSTRDFLKKNAAEMNVSIHFVFESMSFPLAQTYHFHKYLEKNIEVDVVKFARKQA